MVESKPASAPRPGRPRDPAADRAITAATFRLLREEGYRGLSMEAVAAAAGVAKTTIYRRYPSKRDLVVAAMLAETSFPVPPPEMPTREALTSLIRQAGRILIDGRAVRILGTFLAEEAREPELLETFRARLVEPRRAMGLAMLRAGVERGEIRPDANLDMITEMLLGSLLARYVSGRGVDDRWVEELTATIWSAIGTRPAP